MYIVLPLLLLILYLVLRTTNILSLPIFTDEAIYVRWSQIGSRDANWRFISLTDGKQPLFTWIAMVLMRLVPNALLAGRLVSVFSGVAGMTGIGVLAHELFRSKRIALVASFLYVISPFALVYDRMALYDSLVAAFSLWSLYFAVRLVRTLRLDMALVLGMVLGAGMLNKTSGFLSLYLVPVTLLLFDWTAKERKSRLLRWGGLVVLSALLSQMMYSVLRLSPFFHIIGQKDTVFIYTVSEWLTHPVQFLRGNLNGVFDWLIHYLTWPVFVASLLPVVAFWSKIREKAVLYLWWIGPFVALALFGKVLYPRFILFMSMPLLLLAAVTIDWILRRWGRQYVGALLIAIVILPSIYADYFVLTNFAYAPIPQADKGQYISDWPAGGGVKEVNAYLAQEATKGSIIVYTEGTFGLLPYAVEIDLVDNPNIAIRGIWPLPLEPPAAMLEEAAARPTYLITNESQEISPAWPVTLIAHYQKGIRKDRQLRLFRLVLPIAKAS